MKHLTLSALIALVISTSASADTVLRSWWTADQNNDGAYNYSTTAMSGGSTLNVANEWNDAAIGFVLTGPMGDTRVPSIALHFEHNGYGYAEANLPTSGVAGNEPVSFEDRDAGKSIPLRNVNLAFAAPGTQNNVKVKLVDAAGRSSKALSIADYRGDYGRYFFDYKIPTADFQIDGFDYNTVKTVSFFVDGSVPAGTYNLDIVSLNLINVAPIVGPVSAREWWKEDANGDGAYNYSTTTMSGGTTLNTANQWGDAAIGYFLSGPFGDTKIPSVNLHFNHNGQGYAEANLTTEVANTGHEANSFEDRDAGKAINSRGIKLHLSGRGFAPGIKVKLIDAQGRSSNPVEVVKNQDPYARYWFSYSILIENFALSDFDYNSVKSVSFFVDGSTPAGDYDVHVVGISFN